MTCLHRINGLGPYIECLGCGKDIRTKEQLEDMRNRTRFGGAPWLPLLDIGDV